MFDEASYREQIAQAFNLGSEARHDCLPASSCPFDDPAMATSWRNGWLHKDKFHGADVRGRWRCEPLQSVREAG